MRLYSGAPYWLVRNGFANDRPVLDHDEQCDVLVVGAGITGALVADELATAGANVVVIDKREPGHGSTAVSTALLLYETDMELAPLAARIGRDAARRSWQLGRDAIATLGALDTESGGKDDPRFVEAASLYLCSSHRHERRLQAEVELRRDLGFDAEWLDGANLRAAYGIRSIGAVRSLGAGKVDALRMTRHLLRRAGDRGARVYRGTELVSADVSSTGITSRVHGRYRIRSSHLVIATGYEAPELFPIDRLQLRSTFAIATERSTNRADTHHAVALDDVVLWESARPYAYLRSTDDGRLIIGGCDTKFSDALRRDRALPSRVPKLEARLRELLPGPPRETAFSWSGTFGETHDSLPFIGAHPRSGRVLLALGYGGNGITFSVVASRIVVDICLGNRNDDAALFAVDRT